MFYVALTRAADWLYVCHPEREAGSYGKGGSLWGGSVCERRELTRFVSKSAKAAFQQQRAASFRPPEAIPAEGPSHHKPHKAGAGERAGRVP